MGLGLGLGLAPSVAHAEREHVVGDGQNLARIAQRYHVSVAALAAANQLPRDSILRPGQVLRVPERGVVYVRQGDTLSSIARRYQVSVTELARQNRLRSDASVRIGQRLLIPGFEAAAAVAESEKRWGRPKQPGTASLYRVWNQKRLKLRLVDRLGRVRRPALQDLARFLRPRNSKRQKEPHPRLVRLLAQVSDHFGGRPLHIVSGYRLPGGYTKDSSRHVEGHAVDFKIPGVPLQALRDYCARFAHVGVGFYPKSGFIHLDVRRTDARWTDWSSRGEAPVRRAPSEAEPEALAETEAVEGGVPEAADDGQPPIDDQPGALSDE